MNFLGIIEKSFYLRLTMNLKLKFFLPLCLLLLLLLNACGVITKARYGNGLKLNIESNLFARKSPSNIQTSVSKKRSKIKTPPVKSDSNKHVTEIIYVASDPALNDAVIAPEFINAPLQQSMPKASRKNALKDALKDGKKSVLNYAANQSEKRKTEPTVAAGAWLFFGSLVANAYLIYSSLAFPPFVFLLLFLAFFTGMILACIGLHKIKKSQDTYKGKALAISIIVLFFLSLISFLLVLAILSVVF